MRRPCRRMQARPNSSPSASRSASAARRLEGTAIEKMKRHGADAFPIERAIIGPKAFEPEALLHDLAAQLAAFVLVRVDVVIPFAGSEFGGLGIGESRLALLRTVEASGQGNDDAGIHTGIGGTMEMGHDGRAAQSRIGRCPVESLGVGVVGRREASRAR